MAFPTLRQGSPFPTSATLWNRVFRLLDRAADLLESAESVGGGIDFPAHCKTIDSFAAPSGAQMTVGTVELYGVDEAGNRTTLGVQIEAYWGDPNGGTVSAGIWGEVDLCGGVPVLRPGCEAS